MSALLTLITLANPHSLDRSVEDLKAQLMEAMTPADNGTCYHHALSRVLHCVVVCVAVCMRTVPPPMDPAVDTLQHEKAALQVCTATVLCITKRM